MFELGLKVFISYLAGSLNGALLVGKLFGGVDIRTLGSGNAGGTNALRTQGKLFAALVMLVDIGKGVLPVLILPGLGGGLLDADPRVSREWLSYSCGAAAIFGHCYPVWFDFKGGKGAATTLGVLAMLAPGFLLPATAVWFVALFLFGYVGLATVLAAFALPVAVAWSGLSAHLNLFVFLFAVACFVAYTHRSNLSRLLKGEGKPDVSLRVFGRSHEA